ncbi:hypothetical protein CK203_025156 [Vitis vinifera]|uniref:Uncharacterized protein n=1 Tax=Vitis vinifera TaxID=29760 RepID=A0A438JF30_VITVI|nr:hypothetical protein CK203_025156 [Vitis vinifera]
MNMGSEDVNEDLFGLEDEDFGEEINSRMNVTNISSGGSNRGGSGVTHSSFQPMIGQYDMGMKGPTLHEGTMFMQSIDASSMIKMGKKMFELLDKCFGSLVHVLRLVDGEKKAPMGYIYEAMNRAKDIIVRSFNGNEEKYEEIFKIIDKKWEIQLHRPLHAAGLTRDPAKEEKVVAEVSLYTNAQGLFGNELAVRTRKTRAPGRMENEDSHGGAQDNFAFDDDNLTWGDVARATGVEEARFDTRARAKASSSIIPPTRG